MIKPRSAKNFFRSAPAFRELRANLIQQEELLALVRSQLPESLQQHCLATQLKEKGLLILHAESSAWASRLRYFSRDLRIKLQDKGLKTRKIEVRVFIRDPQQKRPARHLHRLSAENARLIEATAESIQDPDLRAALQRLSKHHRN